jgi:guanine deaminase
MPLNFVIRGDMCWSKGDKTLETMPNSFLVCIDGKSAGVFPRLPQQYAALPLFDHGGKLMIPGLVDLHTHAPQFALRGQGMDLELLDWLVTHIFPEEAQFSDLAYARTAYTLFVEHLKRSPNTRIIVYATVHAPATMILMDLLEESGLVSMVGKVNMDRNCPDNLREESAAASLNATREWLDRAMEKGKYPNTKPILTPRFIPSCSDELLRGLGALRRKMNLPVQSHLSESRREIEWVRELCPQSEGYGAAYRDFDLFGNEDLPPTEGTVPSVMAHCVWSDTREMALMAERGVFAAHCPQSNTNLSSGIAPVRRLLDAGVSVGLGSDIAGGANCSIFRAMADAIQVSKLRRTLLNIDEKPLTLEEAFYCGTVVGGSFFGKAGMGYSGSFEHGNDFDALVIDEGTPTLPMELSIRKRLERLIYTGEHSCIEAKYVKGKLFVGSW